MTARVCAGSGADRAVVAALVDGIAAGFDARLYWVLSALVPFALGVAFSPRGSGLAAARGFDSRVGADGPLARLRALAEQGTLLFAPTHGSNLDAPVLGAVLEREGLPRCVYPVGEHLFRNRLVGALMRRLGGYRIERAEKRREYRLALREYSRVLFERGFHSVVFPSGTRNRSNEVEAELKLGFLHSAALAARASTARPIFVVPVAINYLVVLEASWLVHYQLTGRARERVVGDELLVWGRLARSARRLRALEQRAALRFGEPLPLAGVPAHDLRGLAGAIVDQYRALTVLFETHVAARALFDLLARRVATDDVQALLSASAQARSFDAGEVHGAVEQTARLLRGSLDGDTRELAPAELLTRAERAFAACHSPPPFRRAGSAYEVHDVGLLYFYRNRSRHLT